MKFLNTIDGADKVVTSDAQQFISKAEKDKLTGIQAGALNNPHPATHPVSMIEGLQTNLDNKANNSTKIIAGNGLVGGGTLGADTTVTLGTPMGINSSTNNSITTTGHTHELTLTKADITNLRIPAADTNTTYSEISEAEINAGTSSALRTISGRRVKHIMDNTPIYHVGNVDTANKQLLWINTNL